MSNVANRQWPHNQAPAGWPTTTKADTPTTQPYPVVRMPTVPPAAAEILRDAVWHIDAAEHMANGANPKTVRNLGWGGSVLNARCGSTTVANTNDPKFLDFTGTPYVYLPGAIGNQLNMVQAAGVQLSTVAFAVRITLESANGAPTLAGWQSTCATLQITTVGKLIVRTLGTPSTIGNAQSSVAVPGWDGGYPLWVKGKVTASTGVCEYAYSIDSTNDVTAVNWTPLGTPVTGASGTPALTNAVVHFGTNSSGIAGFPGKLHAGAQWQDGVLTHSVDTSVIASGSTTSLDGLVGGTVTINRATSGRKSVAVVAPMWLFGTDDRMIVSPSSLAEFDAGTSVTLVAAMRVWGTSTQRALCKRVVGSGTAAHPGYALGVGTSGGSWYFSDGNQFLYSDAGAAYTAGTTGVTVLSVDRSRNALTDSVNGAAAVALAPGYANLLRSIGGVGGDGGLSAIGQRAPLYVGYVNASATYADMEFMSAAIFRRALSAAEIATLTDYYTRKYK